jgi:hypothetical protein
MAEAPNKIPYPADATERAERIYAEGGMDKDVAAHFGISRQIVYLWRSREKTFDEACERGKAAGEAIRAAAIHDAVSERQTGVPNMALRKDPPEGAADTIGKLCALGHTDFEVAGFFGVSGSLINRWKAEFPDVARAFISGKEVADERVERSLFHRATGYTFEAVKIFNDKGAVTRVDYVEHAAPDTTACIFWLKNRRPELWRDRREVMATSPDGKNLNDLSSDELDRQVVEALRRAQELERRISAATAGAVREAEGQDRPADVRKLN